jgi:hypothetical protein
MRSFFAGRDVSEVVHGIPADLPQLPAGGGRHKFKFNKALKLVSLALADMSIFFSERSAIS